MKPIATSNPVGIFSAPDEPDTAIVVGIRIPVGHLTLAQYIQLGLDKSNPDLHLVPVFVPQSMILGAADKIREDASH